MKNEEEYIEKTEEVEGSPVGTAEEKKGICPVTYEMMRHPWLGEDMAKRIVKENLADDPGFYGFLEEESDEDFEEFADEVIDETMKNVARKQKKVGPAISITIGME